MDDSRLQQMGMNARRAVEREFCWRVTAGTLLDAYKVFGGRKRDHLGSADETVMTNPANING
jgi:hypothetical protein